MSGRPLTIPVISILISCVYIIFNFFESVLLTTIFRFILLILSAFLKKWHFHRKNLDKKDFLFYWFLWVTRFLRTGPVWLCPSTYEGTGHPLLPKLKLAQKAYACAQVWSSVSDAVSMIPRGWDIGPTIPMGPSPWPSWNARSHGHLHEGRPLYIHTYITLRFLKSLGRKGVQITLLKWTQRFSNLGVFARSLQSSNVEQRWVLGWENVPSVAWVLLLTLKVG